MESVGGESTFFFNENEPIMEDEEQEINNYVPQQSFIFGAGQMYGSSMTPPQYSNFPDNDQQKDKDDADDAAPPLISQTMTTTKWGLVFRHWILSTLFLPLYTLALVTRTWKISPNQLSLFQGFVVIFTSLVFYSLLWTSFGLLVTYKEIRDMFPVQQAVFVFFIYFMCCFAESMLKNTQVALNTADNVDKDVYTSGATHSIQPPRTKDTITTISKSTWSVISFIDTIIFISAPTTSKIRGINIITLIISIVYSGFILGLHVYFILDAGTTAIVPIIVYTIVQTLLQGVLCFIILYPLSQVAIRLSVRDKVAKKFSEATTTISINSGRDYTFRLSTLANVKAWQSVRDTLLRRYAFPTLYVDVVISAAFTLWVPLVTVGVMDFLFRSSITSLALNASTLAVLILVYLLICVILASKVQETLSNTDVLRWQEYHFLVASQKDDETEQAEEERIKLTYILKRLAKLIDEGKENAVVFQVWGFPLNRKMATFLGGVLVTLASSIIVRAASKVASF